MTDRIADDWITAYLEYVEESESPDSYHMWTALAVLGAAIGQNYPLGDVRYTISNNIYFILIAKQGRTRKTSAIELGLKLLSEIEEVTVSPGSVSKEDLHRRISESQNIHGESNYVVYARELSTLVKTSGVDTPNYLIELYDNRDELESSTIARGAEKITKPHGTVVAATTPNFVKNGFGGIDMRENGLMSRTMLIYEENPRFHKPFGSKPDKKKAKMLIHDLKVMAADRVRIPMYFAPEAREMYAALYDSIDKEIPKFPLEEAFLARKELHINKVSILLTLSRKPTDNNGCNIGLEVRGEDYQRAIEIVENVQGGLASINAMLGTDKNLHVKLAIIDTLRRRKKVPSKELAFIYMSEVNNYEFHDIMNQLESAGLVGQDPNYYRWRGED